MEIPMLQPVILETTIVLEELRANSESIRTGADGTVWGMVYLDNAIPAKWSRHKFAGHLSYLKANGLYRPTSDSHFGEVKL
jgi:hypothetical protein